MKAVELVLQKQKEPTYRHVSTTNEEEEEEVVTPIKRESAGGICLWALGRFFVLTVGLFAVILLLPLLLFGPRLHYHDSEQATELVVRTTSGRVRGAAEAGEVLAFYGVPFAAPPVRFASPTQAPRWDGVRNATEPAFRCSQWSGGAEDCLYLNIFTKRKKLAPVFFYIHGGGFVSGRAATTCANMTRLTGHLVVAPQYRLGALGFFGNSTDPNFGLQDQLFALRWVRENAAAFGGDPDRIMIFGVSAGGASVAKLLVDPLAQGLFVAAAMESPGGHQGWMLDAVQENNDFIDPELLANNSRKIAVTLGCDDLDCLRGVGVFKLLSEARKLRFAPSLIRSRPEDQRSADGVETPLGLLTTTIPVIVGGQSCESCGDARHLVGPYDPNLSESEYDAGLAAYFAHSRVSPATAKQWYAPRAAQEGRWRALARALSDSGHSCSSQLHADALAGKKNVWRYYFDYTAPDDDYPGARHGGSESWIFDQWHGPREAVLAATIAKWWAALGSDLNPNSGDAPHWDRYDAPGAKVMIVDDDLRMGASNDTNRPECQLWLPYFGYY